MLSIAHTTTGALIATKIGVPPIYIPLVLASHYALDYVVHWDFGTGLSKKKKSKIQALAQEVFIDLPLSLLLVYLIFQHNQSIFNFHAFLGAFVGLVPDFLEAPRNFLGKEPKILKSINAFHGQFHHSTPNIWIGLTPQIILILIIFWLA